MTIPEIDRVCFIGAGTMGAFNSLMTSAAGYESVIHDVSESALGTFGQRQREMAEYLVGAGFFKQCDIETALELVTVKHELAAAIEGAQLISESVAEVLDIKRTVHSALDSVCPPSTLITTNTSSLLVSEIESALSKRERFAALHSHLGSTLIDIVGSSAMDVNTIDLLQRYVKSINCTPLILKKENPGYVLNAMLGPLLSMAMILVIAGKGSVEEVDRAWMAENEASIGMFGMMDMFGLNIIFDNWHKDRLDDRGRAIQPLILGFLQPYIDGNRLGIKTGQGFYHYPSPVYEAADFLNDIPRTELFESLLFVLIENAIALVRKEVVDAQEVDRAWTSATSLEKGPFAWLDYIGTEGFLAIYARQVEAGLSTEHVAAAFEEFLKSRN